MKKKHLHFFSFVVFLGIIVASPTVYAQEEAIGFHNMEPEEDVYQDAFFLALRYKAIGNYKLALEALDQAEKESASDDNKRQAVDFERAKNHYYLKEYQESITYLEKLWELTKQQEVLDWLYQAYMDAREFNAAKEVMVELLGYSEVYLPSFYMLYIDLTSQPEEALQVLDKVFKNNTNTRQVTFYKDLIKESLVGGKPVSGIQANELSKEDTVTLQAYLQNKEWEKAEMYMELLLQDATYASAVLKSLEGVNEKAQLSNSLIILFKKESIPALSKRKLLEILLDNPSNTSLLQSLFPEIYRYLDAQSLKIIGDYFVSRTSMSEAAELYLMSLAISFDNYSLIVETLQLLSDIKEYNEQLELAETAIEYYPLQPVLYLYKGDALLGMQLWAQAKKVLEEGASYITDNPQLEEDFSNRLQQAIKQLN